MLSILLFPFSIWYGWITRFRNFLYDADWKKTFSFAPAIIGVGNLNVGGTGKTPMIEYLVKVLSPRYSIAILSRGYGRKTKGYKRADATADAATIGDEPFQFYKKFGASVMVAVCESRVEGITQILHHNPEVEVILLDDSFQHRAVKPLLSILLTDFSKPFFNDRLLPRGRLRESRAGSARADVVIVTKCPSHSSSIQLEMETSIQKYAKQKPIFFTGIQYQSPVSMSGAETLGRKVVLATGVANSKLLVENISTHYQLLHHFAFEDHHDYSVEEIKMIEQQANALTAQIITTEKDIAKISSLFNTIINAKLWFYLPIETYFLNAGSEFNMLVKEKIEGHLSTHSFKP